MLLLTLLLSLGLQRYLHLFPEKRLQTYQHYFKWFEPLLSRGGVWAYVGGILLVGLPVVVLAIIKLLIGWWIFGLINFILAVMVLWYCLDGRDYNKSLQVYFDAASKNDHSAQHEAIAEAFGAKIEPRQVAQRLFTRAPASLFSSFFWYIVLGPLMVLFYFGLVMLKTQLTEDKYPALDKLVSLLIGLIDWVPVRLLTLGFALVGHFVSTFGIWLKQVLTGISHNVKLLVAAGFTAMELEADKASGDQAEIQKAIAMLDRSLILWLVVLALLTLGGWVF